MQFDDSTIARFWAKVDKSGACWLWTGSRDDCGYGFFKVHTRLARRSHRIAWEMTNGVIPEGQCVLHNCPGGDNPACCNPAHLWLGTDAENVADRDAKGRTATRERHWSAKLTEAQVSEIRTLYQPGVVGAPQLARRFGVCTSTVQRIVWQATWKEVRDE